MLKFLIAILCLLLVGCPESQAPTVVDTCSKSGEKCRIQKGQLGVCMMQTDGSFHCAPQH